MPVLSQTREVRTFYCFLCGKNLRKIHAYQDPVIKGTLKWPIQRFNDWRTRNLGPFFPLSTVTIASAFKCLFVHSPSAPQFPVTVSRWLRGKAQSFENCPIWPSKKASKQQQELFFFNLWPKRWKRWWMKSGVKCSEISNRRMQCKKSVCVSCSVLGRLMNVDRSTGVRATFWDLLDWWGEAPELQHLYWSCEMTLPTLLPVFLTYTDCTASSERKGQQCIRCIGSEISFKWSNTQRAAQWLGSHVTEFGLYSFLLKFFFLRVLFKKCVCSCLCVCMCASGHGEAEFTCDIFSCSSSFVSWFCSFLFLWKIDIFHTKYS